MVGITLVMTCRVNAFTDEVERRLGKLREFEPAARRIVEMMVFAPKLDGALHSDGASAGNLFSWKVNVKFPFKHTLNPVQKVHFAAFKGACHSFNIQKTRCVEKNEPLHDSRLE